MRILVTDGHLKAALCAVRSLGRRGHEVHTTQDRNGRTLCSTSAFHFKSHVLPPYNQADNFDSELLRLLRRLRFDYILPASEGAVRRLSANRDAVQQLSRIDLPPNESLQLVLSKTGLIRFARSIGIPVPVTVFYDGHQTADEIARTLNFPIVAKSARGDTFDRVAYLNSSADVRAVLTRSAADNTLHFQEFIPGGAYGCSMLFENGRPALCQMHQRIWEYPVTGGPSVYARTITDAILRELSTRLLAALNWNGLAMVEFKKSDKDGLYKLMEINPRLWGSLDLSVAAGADFPYVASQPDRSDALSTLSRRETSFLWLFPDALLFLLACPTRLTGFLKIVLSARVGKNIVFDDLRPFARQAREALYWVKTLWNRGLRYPQGRPGLKKSTAKAAMPTKKQPEDVLFSR